MKHRSNNNNVVVAVALTFLLLLVGGAAIYLFIGRQQMALAREAQRAHLVLAEATMRAEKAQADAEAALALSTASDDNESSTGQDDAIRDAVEEVFRAQQEAWNRGDLDAFMEHYWNSEQLTFSSGGKTTRGWAETLNGYRERYPTAEKMGRVTFRELEITPLGDSAALVLGKWNLQRESAPLSGNFTLVIRKFDDRWLIVHDHTSRLME